MRTEEIRIGVAQRLRGRRREIERATLTRIHALSETEVDPEYLEGLRGAVVVAIDYGIDAIESSEDAPPPVPPALLAQARLAARHGVKLETVLRRYVAGYSLLADFIIEEAERDGLMTDASLKRLFRLQATLLDRLVAAVSGEYTREEMARPRSAGERHARKVERMLGGELVDTADLAYDFDAPHHLAAIATGPAAADAITTIVGSLDGRRLVIERDAGTVWTWLGSRRRIDPDELKDQVHDLGSTGLEALALGEPGRGLSGWRLTHQQARAALPVARSDSGCARYGDVVLLAATLQDDLAATSLQQLFLEPLSAERDGGEVARETLRAYFAAQQNMTSAAASLGVNRNTVASRLRAIEARIGRSLAVCGPEVAVALRLEELDGGEISS